MAYLGNTPAARFSAMDKQTITGDGTTGPYTLTHSVGNEQEIEVFVNNVRQEPSVAYTVSGTDLTMTGNVASTDDFYVVFQGLAQQTATHPSTHGLTATSGTFNSTLTATGGLNVGTIKDATGTTTAMTINSNGGIFTPARPIFSVRGVATSTSLTAAHTNFDYCTSWTTTDVNVGGLLNAGGYAEVPTGFAGLYQITWVQNKGESSTHNSSWLYIYDGSAYEEVFLHWAYNDYTYYTTGTTLFRNLSEGDKVYAGWSDSYSAGQADNWANNFSMMFVG